MSLYKKIKRVRDATGMNQESFAKAIGMTRSNYANIETGRQLPSAETLSVIVTLFKRKLEWLTYEWIFDKSEMGDAPPTAPPTAPPKPKKYDDTFSVEDNQSLLSAPVTNFHKPKQHNIPGEDAQQRYIAALERTVADKMKIIELMERLLKENEKTIKSALKSHDTGSP